MTIATIYEERLGDGDTKPCLQRNPMVKCVLVLNLEIESPLPKVFMFTAGLDCLDFFFFLFWVSSSAVGSFGGSTTNTSGHTDFIMSCIHGVVRNRQLHLAGSTDGIGIHVLGIVICNSTNPTCICQQKLAFQFNTLPPRHLQAPGSQLRVPPGCQQREGFEGD